MAKKVGVRLDASELKIVQKCILSNSSKLNQATASGYLSTSSLRQRLLRKLRKLRKQVPIELALGFSEFCGYALRVKSGVLLPRTETEELVRLALGILPQNPHPTIVEMGTGSGAITVALIDALHQQGREFNYIGYEPAYTAYLVTLKNVSQLAKPAEKDRVRIVNGSLQKNTRFKRAHIALLIANPPYIPAGELTNPLIVQPSVIRHEPVLALDGGPDGLDPYRILYSLCLTHTIDNLVLETHHLTAKSIGRMFEDGGRYRVQVKQDEFGYDRYVLAQLIS